MCVDEKGAANCLPWVHIEELSKGHHPWAFDKGLIALGSFYGSCGKLVRFRMRMMVYKPCPDNLVKHMMLITCQSKRRDRRSQASRVADGVDDGWSRSGGLGSGPE